MIQIRNDNIVGGDGGGSDEERMVECRGCVRQVSHIQGRNLLTAQQPIRVTFFALCVGHAVSVRHTLSRRPKKSTC